MEGGVLLSRPRVGLCCLSLLLLVPATLQAVSWPEIPESERQLRQVPGHPEASAVVLFERGRLVLSSRALSSFLEVYRRIKVLTDEGVDHGSVALFSSDAYRMKELKGRTHRPDGGVVELGTNAVFEREHSRYYNRSVTTFAMPEVTVGSIVEYSYRIYFDSVLYPTPWYFQGRIPVLHSEIACVAPRSYQFSPHAVCTLNDREIEREEKQTALGVELTLSMSNLPPVPDEPFRLSFADLSSRVTFIPQSFAGRMRVELLSGWSSAIQMVQGTGRNGYSNFRSGSRAVKRKARVLAGSMDTPRHKAEVIYRWVRDRIVTERWASVWVGDKTGNDILKAGRGDYVEKALLLQMMLDAVGVDASVAWTSSVTTQRVQQEVANPAQFDTVLVVAELGGEMAFLDPTDRTLGFGMLQPDTEGVPCLLVDRKEPDWVTTPLTPAEQSAKHARLALRVDDDGRLAGTASLRLGGHPAWRHLGWKPTMEETVDAWTEWLEKEFGGFDITEVRVDEQIEERLVTVWWSIRQRGDEVLGDQVTLSGAAPLTQKSTPFILTPDRRSTPVHIPFASLEVVELELSWPEGWLLDAVPEPCDHLSPAGSYRSETEVDETGRWLKTIRTSKLAQRGFSTGSEYALLTDLLHTTVTHDAALVVLTREARCAAQP